MKTCIYCRQSKEDSEFSLEHVIPKFLGGAYAPDEFKTHNVCRKCNSDLGLFVDAAVKKNFLAANILNEIIHGYYDPKAPKGMPLTFMGLSDLKIPQMDPRNEVCEALIGPLGEQVYWVRPKDKKLECYVGGNPITAKTKESRAYFFFSERSCKCPMLSWLTFKDAFKGLKVRKIMCTTVEGISPAHIGFSAPDIIDKDRTAFLQHVCFSDQKRSCQIPIDLRADCRFLAKIGIGIAHSLFGIKILRTDYAEELYKALWHKPEDPLPQVRGASFFSNPYDEGFKRLTGEEHAVTVTIQKVIDAVLLTVNISAKLVATVQIAKCDDVSPQELEAIGDGQVLILYRPLKQCIRLSYAEYLAHKCGTMINEEIENINAMTNNYIDFFKNL